MAAVRALAARGVRDLHLIGVPQMGFQADMLIGAGCVDTVESAAVTLGEFGLAPCFTRAVRNVYLFTLAHSRRVLVDKVEFVSAPGTSAPNVYRPGSPRALITNRCVFNFDVSARRFTLHSVHPGETVQSIREHTGFAYDEPDRVPTTPLPGDDVLALVRGPVADAIAELYPDFAARVFARVNAA